MLCLGLAQLRGGEMAPARLSLSPCSHPFNLPRSHSTAMAYPHSHSLSVLKRLIKLLPPSPGPTQHVLILEGGKIQCRDDTGKHPD